MEQSKKRNGGHPDRRKRKNRIAFEEYRERYLQVPRITSRKPVFISGEVRERIDEMVRRLGGRGMSVSGFIENLTRHHLSVYEKDIEIWRKL